MKQTTQLSTVPPVMTIGTRVLYRGAWGTEAARPGVITSEGAMHKGRLAYDVKLDDGASHWGYEYQFEVQP